MPIYTYTCIYVHIYIHTYIHTHNKFIHSLLPAFHMIESCHKDE